MILVCNLYDWVEITLIKFNLIVIGAPLMNKFNGKWHIYGIVTYITTEKTLEGNKSRCIVSQPSFYTKISTYYKWIAVRMN